MKTRRGSVSAFALLGMSVILLVMVGASGLAGFSLSRARSDARSAVAFNAAQAGLEHGIALTLEQLQENKGVFDDDEYDFSSAFAAIAPGSTVYVTVVPDASDQMAYITATATFENRTKSVRALLSAKDVGIWNNAIFAGTGAAGRTINGNVDIRGSVHILGDGEEYSDLNGNGQWDAAEPYNDLNKNGVWDPGEPYTDVNGDGVRNPAEPYNDSNGNGAYDPPLTQADLNSSFSGNAYIGNNYSGMPLALEQLVPPPPRPGNIESLGTEVRVKHGKVAISGSASIGTDDVVDGGTSKSTIDGAYVNDGYTGSQGSNAVFSDNGTNKGYDLGAYDIDFPLLNGIGAQPYTDSTGAVWSTQEAFLNARALTINVNSITSTTQAFSFGPDQFGNRIQFTPAGNKGNPPAQLTITGIVRVNGDLQLGNKDQIRYRGNGTLYATQDMRIDGDLLPVAGETFPTTARMGFIAKRNMHLAAGNGSSQLSMAGAFYAQGTIFSAKQNQIAGTFVANFYDMGTNVPNIYQVPALAKNMPPGMPGDMSIVSLRYRSWRERQ